MTLLCLNIKHSSISLTLSWCHGAFGLFDILRCCEAEWREVVTAVSNCGYCFCESIDDDGDPNSDPKLPSLLRVLNLTCASVLVPLCWQWMKRWRSDMVGLEHIRVCGAFVLLESYWMSGTMDSHIGTDLWPVASPVDSRGFSCRKRKPGVINHPAGRLDVLHHDAAFIWSKFGAGRQPPSVLK